MKGISSKFWQASNLDSYNRKVFSQNGEDGIIEEIFRRIGTDSKYSVEFGVEDGSECNTRFLIEQRGWDSLRMDGSDNNPEHIKKEYITPENINKLFKKYNVPKNLDLLSIDIDSNDIYVWKALNTEYRPRLVIVEYNATIAPCFSEAVKYEPGLTWDGT
ncbi:MAG TPA: hypothetical protein PL191_00865, partial [Candidatus Saccharimonas sp.]|nr:hypothetical protein [Candidatus Saccharimonas sp.]